MLEQTALSPDQQADVFLQEMLADVASMFPLTDLDYEMIKYGKSSYHMRKAEGKGHNQITVVRGASGKPYIGSHSEEEELEAKSDPDLQFFSSWVDALLHTNSRRPNPERIIQVVTQRWMEGDDSKLVLLPPDSIARQQYIQFAPGSMFLVDLNGAPAKLPIECFYPWEYYSRPLPAVLEGQNADWPHKADIADCIKRMILKVSSLFPPTSEDNAIVDMAKAEILVKFAYGFWQLASAFITESGNIRVGFGGNEDDEKPVAVQHDTKTGRANTDAEQAAIKKARRLFPGEQFKAIVTAHHSTNNHNHGERIGLVSSCALCRKSLLRHSPNGKMLIPLNGEGVGKVPFRTLYPLPDFVVPSLL